MSKNFSLHSRNNSIKWLTLTNPSPKNKLLDVLQLCDIWIEIWETCLKWTSASLWNKIYKYPDVSYARNA